jgi:hypothetical protein
MSRRVAALVAGSLLLACPSGPSTVVVEPPPAVMIEAADPEPSKNAVVAAQGAEPCDSSECCVLAPGTTVRIDIVESRSNIGQEMDTRWLAAAKDRGHDAEIRPQELLDRFENLTGTDVLVVSSGVIAMPRSRVEVIVDFVAAGKGVYLQSEYEPTYEANVAFAAVVNELGGRFTWTQSLSGELQPATPSGCLATTPNRIAALDYFWYGATGEGSPEVVLRSNAGQAIGWSWCRRGGGMIITTTDQDLIKDATSEDVLFMDNVIALLGRAAQCVPSF